MQTNTPRSQNGCARRFASPDSQHDLPRALQAERERFRRNAPGDGGSE